MFPSRCSGQSPVHSEVAHNGRVVLPEWCGGTPFCGQYQRLQWLSLDIQVLSLASSIPCVIGSGALDGFAVQVRLHIVSFLGIAPVSGSRLLSVVHYGWDSVY